MRNSIGIAGYLKSPVRSLGARRGRAGSVAVAVVGILVVAAIIAGVGSRASLPQPSAVGAWLGSSGLGALVHGNGLPGRPDGQISLRGANGHPLRVVQDGSAAYVIDVVTGQKSRIDPAQLVVGQMPGDGTAGVQVVAGSGVAYLVDPKAGMVLQINPTSLAQMGEPISLRAPLGQAGLDGRGTLWVPDLATGSVVSVRAGKKRSSVGVGSPHDQLDLTMAAGNPVVTDISKAVTTVVGSKGAKLRVSLPPAVAGRSARDLLVPATVDGSILPVLSLPSDALVLVDLGRGSVSTVSLMDPGHELGAPQALGHRVYVPDRSTGSLVVYDAAAGQFDSPITVTGQPANLDAFVQNGQLWVIDPNSPTALVVNPDGSVHTIGKNDAQVPGSGSAGPPNDGAGAAPAAGGSIGGRTAGGSGAGGGTAGSAGVGQPIQSQAAAAPPTPAQASPPTPAATPAPTCQPNDFPGTPCYVPGSHT